MEKYLNILKKCPLFFNIEDESLLKMLNCLGAKIEFFDKKYTIFSEGKSAKYIGIVLSGSAQIIQIDYYGNRSILSNVEAGEMFGEAFACAETEALPVSVVANELCDITKIPHLYTFLQQKGLEKGIIDKIFYKNAYSTFDKWGLI